MRKGATPPTSFRDGSAPLNAFRQDTAWVGQLEPLYWTRSRFLWLKVVHCLDLVALASPDGLFRVGVVSLRMSLVLDSLSPIGSVVVCWLARMACRDLFWKPSSPLALFLALMQGRYCQGMFAREQAGEDLWDLRFSRVCAGWVCGTLTFGREGMWAGRAYFESIQKGCLS